MSFTLSTNAAINCDPTQSISLLFSIFLSSESVKLIVWNWGLPNYFYTQLPQILVVYFWNCCKGVVFGALMLFMFFLITFTVSLNLREDGSSQYKCLQAFCPVLYVFYSYSFCAEIVTRLNICMMHYSICCCYERPILSAKCLPKAYTFLRTKTCKNLLVRDLRTMPDVYTAMCIVRHHMNIQVDENFGTKSLWAKNVFCVHSRLTCPPAHTEVMLVLYSFKIGLQLVLYAAIITCTTRAKKNLRDTRVMLGNCFTTWFAFVLLQGVIIHQGDWRWAAISRKSSGWSHPEQNCLLPHEHSCYAKVNLFMSGELIFFNEAMSP